MIQSMTGYGRASAGQGNNKISIIIKSVNGRFLDLKLRGFDFDPSVDKKIRDLISDRLIRGTVHINFESDTNQSSNSLIFNEDRFKLLLKIFFLLLIHLSFSNWNNNFWSFSRY